MVAKRVMFGHLGMNEPMEHGNAVCHTVFFEYTALCHQKLIILANPAPLKEVDQVEG